MISAIQADKSIMGGIGSGTRAITPRCENMHPVDLSALYRFATAGRGSCRLSYRFGGRLIGWVDIAPTADDSLRLSHVEVRYDGTEARQSAVVRLTSSHQPLGGARMWLACPKCGRGCRVLYALCGFRCRVCAGLIHTSQTTHKAGRALLQVQKLRMGLGGSASLCDPFPDKPKGMHWQTYRRLEAQYEELQTRWTVAAMRRLGFRGPR